MAYPIFVAAEALIETEPRAKTCCPVTTLEGQDTLYDGLCCNVISPAKINVNTS